MITNSIPIYSGKYSRWIENGNEIWMRRDTSDENLWVRRTNSIKIRFIRYRENLFNDRSFMNLTVSFLFRSGVMEHSLHPSFLPSFQNATQKHHSFLSIRAVERGPSSSVSSSIYSSSSRHVSSGGRISGSPATSSSDHSSRRSVGRRHSGPIRSLRQHFDLSSLKEALVQCLHKVI